MAFGRLQILLALLATGMLADAAVASNKHALVVGVNTYENLYLGENDPNLEKPEADARAVSDVLKERHAFDVELLVKDGTRRAFIEAAWSRTLQKVNKGDVVLFYFAGHGIELKGRNYLLPRDATYSWKNPENADVLIKSSIDLQRMIEEFAQWQEITDALGIIIIDACRENPLPRAVKGGDIEIGLGPQVVPPGQLFIMYSAGIGQTALDGGNAATHSVYAMFLLKLLENKDLPLTELAQRVRLDVYMEALTKYDNHRQTPAYYDQLRTNRTVSGEPSTPERFVAQENKSFVLTRSLGPRDVLIECTYCPEMVVVGGGRLSAGASNGGRGRIVETPPKYAIGKFEVTNREWNRCVHDGHCKGKPKSSTHEPRLELRPVANVSWEDAKDFVNWLIKETGEKYRLPTEVEWEYAARAGVMDAPYFFASAGLDPLRSICDYANGADRRVGPLPFANPACDDRVGRETAQVGSYKPNKFGLHDMYGNVWEWVQDCAHRNGEGSDAATSRSCAHRIARGGSWRSGPDALASNARHAFPPAHRRPTLGFRVARDVAD